jgi:uncharacterized protein YaiI (UPF0178 family)
VLHIYVDADACPVKQEVYRVAARCKLPVTLVANSRMRIPEGQGIALQVVGGGFDEADNWIVEHVEANDIVITADIPLAARCLKKGAAAIGTSGKPFREDSIGQAIATRELMADLRAGGEITGGPAPLTDRDRSNFLQALDQAIQAIRRKSPPKPA